MFNDIITGNAVVKIQDLWTGKNLDSMPKNKIRHKTAKALVGTENLATRESTMELYWWNGTYWKEDGEKKLQRELQRLIGDTLSTHDENEILHKVKLLSIVDDVLWDRDRYIATEKHTIEIIDDGDIEIKKRECERGDYLTKKINAEYDQEVGCPRIKQFLSEVTGSEEDRKTLEEVAGYCLYNAYPIQKGILLTGDGANGKSTFLTLLKRFFGMDNCSAIPLSTLSENRFATTHLIGKLANIYPDLSSKTLKYTGRFKALTGGDMVPFEIKRGKRGEFMNTAKLIFSANEIPYSYDITPAFLRRWVIVEFPHTFRGDDADQQLLEKLTTEGELSGFLNLAIQGLKRLLKNEEFSTGLDDLEVKRNFDSLEAFVDEKIEVDYDAFVVKKDFYQEYAKYCERHDVRMKTHSQVGKQIKHITPVAQSYRPTVEEGRRSAWKRIAFKDGGLKEDPRESSRPVRSSPERQRDWSINNESDGSDGDKIVKQFAGDGKLPSPS